MEEISYLIKDMLKNKTNRALDETISLLQVVRELYAREFIETYSLIAPDEYERKKQELTMIQHHLTSACMSLAKIKKEMPIY